MKKSRLFAVLLAAVIAVSALCACLSVSAAKGDNLALGKSYTGAETSTKEDVKKYSANLTDGNAATKMSTAVGDWFAFYYQEQDGKPVDGVNAPNRVGTFTIDLGAVSAVGSVKINTFTGNMWGVVPPKSVKVEYSTDNTDFSTLEEKTFTIPAKEKGEDGKDKDLEKIENIEYAGQNGSVSARYIKVTVTLQDNAVFAFLNEVEVLEGDPVGGETSGDDGSTDASSDESSATDSSATESEPSASAPTESSSAPAESSSTPAESSSTSTESSSTSTESSSAPAESASAPAESASTPAASGSTGPTTGDAGLIGFAVLAVVAISGVAIAVKVRK